MNFTLLYKKSLINIIGCLFELRWWVISKFVMLVQPPKETVIRPIEICCFFETYTLKKRFIYWFCKRFVRFNKLKDKTFDFILVIINWLIKTIYDKLIQLKIMVPRLSKNIIIKIFSLLISQTKSFAIKALCLSPNFYDHYSYLRY